MHCIVIHGMLNKWNENETIFHKSVQLIGYADDINIMGRTKRANSDVYGELKERAYHKCR